MNHLTLDILKGSTLVFFLALKLKGYEWLFSFEFYYFFIDGKAPFTKQLNENM